MKPKYRGHLREVTQGHGARRYRCRRPAESYLMAATRRSSSCARTYVDVAPGRRRPRSPRPEHVLICSAAWWWDRALQPRASMTRLPPEGAEPRLVRSCRTDGGGAAPQQGITWSLTARGTPEQRPGVRSRRSSSSGAASRYFHHARARLPVPRAPRRRTSTLTCGAWLPRRGARYCCTTRCWRTKEKPLALTPDDAEQAQESPMQPTAPGRAAT